MFKWCGFFKILLSLFAIHDRIHIFNQPISDKPSKSWGIETEHTLKSVVQLVNIFNCLAFNWTLKDKGRVTYSDPKRDSPRWKNIDLFIFIYSKSITYTNSLTCSCSYTPLTGTNSWYILLLWCSKYSACVCIYKKQTIARIKMSFIIKFSK